MTQLGRQAWWLGPVFMLAFLAAALWLAWSRNRVPFGWQLLLWAMLLTVFGVIVRRGAQQTFGPVFFYDLVRTARREHQIGHRCLYAVLLLGLLFLVYWSWYPDRDLVNLWYGRTISPADRARFAGSFFTAFLAIQFAVVLLVTPTYTAGAIAEQKERRTLEFLLVTDLSNREIVLGALAARLGNLWLLVMVGLPIVSLLEFLGGVDPELLLAGFAATAMMTLSLGGMSILVSVNARTTLGAVVGTYLALLVGLFVSAIIPGLWYANPFYALAYVMWYMTAPRTDLLPSLLAFCTMHGLVALICCRMAVSQVRRVARMQAGGPTEVSAPPGIYRAIEKGEPYEGKHGWGPYAEPEMVHPYVARTDQTHLLQSPRPPVGEDGLLWKELYAERRFGPPDPISFFSYLLAIITFITALTILPIGFTALVAESWNKSIPLGEHTQPWVRGFGIGLSCLLLLIIALNAAHRVSRERERQTLETLFTIPSDRSIILFLKWLASILSTRSLWWCLLTVWAFGLLTGGMNPFALPFLVAASLVYAGFVASLGLWFSTFNKSTLRSTLFTLLSALVLIAGLNILLKFITGVPLGAQMVHGRSRWYDIFMEYGLTPPVTIWTLTFRADDLLQGKDAFPFLRIVAALAGLHCYLAAGVILWLSSISRLNAEKGPAPATPRRAPGREHEMSDDTAWQTVPGAGRAGG
jgi:ABC-type transport system involved in multi-copper enzyme maturation permease subunit